MFMPLKLVILKFTYGIDIMVLYGICGVLTHTYKN